MKTLVKSLILSSVVALSISSAAVARDYPVSTKQERMERSWEYWNKKTDSNVQKSQQVSDNTQMAMPKVSKYPCARCVYSQELGGYIQKHYGK